MSYTAYIYAACVAVFILVLVFWSNRHPEFKLTDLITGDNDKISLRKFSALVALFSSTWVFVTLTEQGKLTEWFFTGYITVWAAQKVASDITGALSGGAK